MRTIVCDMVCLEEDATIVRVAINDIFYHWKMAFVILDTFPLLVSATFVEVIITPDLFSLFLYAIMKL